LAPSLDGIIDDDRARYLEVARRAIGDVCKLAGLDTVSMMEPTKANDVSQLSTEEVQFRLARAVAALTPAPPLKTVTAPSVNEPREEMTTEERAYAEILARRQRAKDGGN